MYKRQVEGLLKLQDTGESATLLGIGPMSPNLLQASFEIAKDYDFPLMFIASRNQVDADALGGGYVNGWDQKRFREDIRRVAEQVGFDGLYYLCRDHGTCNCSSRDSFRYGRISRICTFLSYP